jgi:hypothetical protein
MVNLSSLSIPGINGTHKKRQYEFTLKKQSKSQSLTDKSWNNRPNHTNKYSEYLGDFIELRCNISSCVTFLQQDRTTAWPTALDGSRQL